MSYLLDSNTVIARLNGDALVSERLQGLAHNQVILCAPVLAELEFGAQLSARREANQRRLYRLAEGLRFEPFGLPASLLFGRVKARLRKRGITKSDFDLAIVCIAMTLDAVLVTDDRALHDGSIPDLEVENWLQELR